jgi:catechol 2,3-dioxygenase-like lactoylglutathione lyase family enzyme
MVTFGRVTPSIYVHDMERSLEFYRDILGFSVVFTNGSPISFAVLRQDAASIHLSVRPQQAGSCHTHIMLSDLDSLYGKLTSAGVISHGDCGILSWPIETETPLNSPNSQASLRRFSHLPSSRRTHAKKTPEPGVLAPAVEEKRADAASSTHPHSGPAGLPVPTWGP